MELNIVIYARRKFQTIGLYGWDTCEKWNEDVLGQAYHWIPIIKVADGISIVCAIMIWLYMKIWP